VDLDWETDARLVPDLEDLRRRRSAKWTKYADDVLPAWVAEMDLSLAEPITEALAEAVAAGDAGYGNPEAAGLSEAFAAFAERRLGWSVDPARVLHTGDVVAGLAALIEVLTEPGEGVIINPPVYYPFFPLVADRGRRLVEVPMAAGRELDVEAIDRAFAAGARAIVLCSPHNPTGSIPGREVLEALAESAVRHDAWVLSDEIHAPLTLPGASFTPFLEVSEAARERGIAVTSASKAFNVAGLMCAQIVTAGDAAAERADRIAGTARHAGHYGVLAAAAAFSDPRSDAWLDRAVELLDSNRTLLGELLAEQLPDARWVPPEAGYLAWIDLSAYGLGPDPAPALLEHGRIALSPGPQFGTGGDGFVRLNVATSPELVREAVARIAGGVRGIGR
jgi:cysteine-S-conjugate beta-lyase